MLEEAKEQLDRATHILMDVIDGEERRLSEQRERQGGGGGSGPAPLVLTLWRCVFKQAVGMGSAVGTMWERLWARVSGLRW